MKFTAVILTTDRSPRRNFLSSTLIGMIESGLCEDKRFTLDILHSGEADSNLDPRLVSATNATLHTVDEKVLFNVGMANALNVAADQNPDYVIFSRMMC